MRDRKARTNDVEEIEYKICWLHKILYLRFDNTLRLTASRYALLSHVWEML